MKEPSERGQRTNPQQKKKQRRRLTTLIVQAGIAGSVREAQEMLAAAEICVNGRDHGWPVTVSGERIFSDPGQYGRTMFDEGTQITHRSKCPKCGRRPIAFVKKDKKPAISSATHSRVLDEYESEDREHPAISSLNLDSRVIRQQELERWFLRRRDFMEMDRWIVSALSMGATVEKGVHIAELVPVYDEDGSTYLKLVVR